MAELFSGSSISGMFPQWEQLFKKEKASSQGFPVEVHPFFSEEKLLKNAVISNQRFVGTNKKWGLKFHRISSTTIKTTSTFL